MSRGESNVDNTSYIDTLSSGDSNAMKTVQQYKEENNNEIDELSKELTDMGCIVDAVKRPPNICVEDCVYESDFDEASYKEDGYSDEFEEDKSDGEVEESVELDLEAKEKSPKSEDAPRAPSCNVKLSKSQFSMTSNKMSVSGRTDYGSVSVPPTRRVNMSFTNERLREIERHNHILLTKILSARNSRKSTIPPREQPVRKNLPPAAVLRKNQQKKIDHENMILLKKIQGAKSSAYSVRR